MGVGKTTVGQKLARDLGQHFFDLDQAIAAHVGQPTPSFFTQVGEPTFREIEANLLERALEQEDVVISTGGGVIETPSCVTLLNRADVYTIWLDSEFSTVADRLLATDEIRPLALQYPLTSFFHYGRNDKQNTHKRPI